MRPHAAIRPLLGRKYSGARTLLNFARPLNIHLGSKRRTLGNAERQDFAPDSPRGNAICRMVDASEIAFVAVFLASDKACAVSGELVAATGGGRADGILLTG